jgi:hemerythrin-like domain-containing protein
MPIQIGRRPDHGFDEPLGLLSDCHRRIEYFLGVLCAIGEQAAGGLLSASQRAELESALRYFATAAPKHTADEEQSLFPRLRASTDADAARALDIVARLEKDHGEAARHHSDVDVLVRRWLDAGRLDVDDVRALNDGLARLRAIYAEHIAVEDRDVFPIAGRLLSAEQLREVGREMAARRAPAADLQRK